MRSALWLGWVLLSTSGCTPFTGGLGTGEDTGGSGSTSGALTSTGPGTTATTTAVDDTTTSVGVGSTTAAETSSGSESGEPEAFFRREVVIHGNQVPGDEPLLDFTVLITFAGDTGLSHVDSGGHVLELDAADLVFRDANLQPLARQLVSYGPATGRLSVWVRVPEIAADADTTLYLDYGAPSLVNLSQVDAWNDDYVGVWHFEDTVVDGGMILDSGPLATHGTAVDLAAANSVAGRVGQGLSFTGPNAAVWFAGGVLDLPGPLTFEGWGRMDGSLASNGFQRLFNKGGVLNRPLSLWVGDTTVGLGQAVFAVNYEDPIDYVELLYPIPEFALGQWHHYAAVAGGPGNDVALFVDGVRVQSTTFADAVETGHPNLYFGNWDIAGASRTWSGAIDEYRFSNVARSDEWIELGYRTQAMPTAVTTVGGTEYALP